MSAPVSPISVSFPAAVGRIAGVARRTPLEATDLGGPGIDLRLKLECLQETGSFKVRGAWNQISQLTPEQRLAGVVTTSSGNHGRALAWAAQRAGVPATICMPADAYPNKIQACRDLGANVELGATRGATDDLCRALAAGGMTLIHPYDDLRTIEGAGTVGWEIAQDCPDVQLVVIPVGGGGLLAGSALALRDQLGSDVRIIGVEPAGAPTMTRALAAGHPVTIDNMTTNVQGLCPPHSGELNRRVAAQAVDAVVLVEDEDVYRAQRVLVNDLGYVVEPAGAATLAAWMTGALAAWLGDATAVALVVSGGNPAPEQLAHIRSLGA